MLYAFCIFMLDIKWYVKHMMDTKFYVGHKIKTHDTECSMQFVDLCWT